jgi:tetratricopeptide (TPR) repeat protein
MKKVLLVLVAAIMTSTNLLANDKILIRKTQAPLLKGLGQHTHKISSDINGVQRYFDQGLIMSFAFNHAEAIRSFIGSQRLDPECAMCFWGEALALGPNINVNSDGKVIMSPENRIQAYKAIKKALDLSKKSPKKEQDYIKALSARYDGNPKTSRVNLDIAYAKAMEELSKKYPDDNDAASLYAEALMNTMPWDYWADNGNPKLDTVKVIESLERVLKNNPNHPLAIHLYIHAVEASSNPSRAEKYADKLADLVPGAGHLVHMPAHIYWRVGRYNDASIANINAAKVDEDYIAQCNSQGLYPAMYYPHNIHFLWAASTMEGRSELSINSALKVSSYIKDEQIRQIPFIEFFQTLPLLSYIRFAKWEEILSYKKPNEDFKFSLGIYHYARSIAFSSLGNFNKAKNEQKKILVNNQSNEIKVLIKAGQPSDKLLEISNLLALGQIELNKENFSSAIEYFRNAVKIQDQLPYREPEFWYYPTRQTLGHALLLNKDFNEALKVFNEDLKQYPKNGWSYYGLHVAYNGLNNKVMSDKVMDKFNKIWQFSDIKINSSIIY